VVTASAGLSKSGLWLRRSQRRAHTRVNEPLPLPTAASLGRQAGPWDGGFQGNTWHSGDGGFVAKFSDGTVTDSTWKAQSFYIAPLQHPDDVVAYGNIHDTSHLGGRIHPLAKLPTCREHCFAVHYAIPDG
jgi:hypothetical protein